MNIELLNSLEDIAWLQTTHLKHHPNITFNAFLIYGNEDCPEKVELYRRQNPTVNSKPFATFIADDDGNLQLSP